MRPIVVVLFGGVGKVVEVACSFFGRLAEMLDCTGDDEWSGA
jgi:hypothetical protein